MRIFLAELDNLLTGLRQFRMKREKKMAAPVRVFDFSQFMGGQNPRGRALVSFVADSLLQDAACGSSSRFNPNGACLEIVHALNELGYIVDVVNLTDTAFRPQKPYDLFICHTSTNYHSIVEHLPPSARIVLYTTGSYGQDSLRHTNERYARFCKSRNLPLERVEHCRKVTEQVKAVTSSDLVFALGNETSATYRGVARRVIAINNAAYLNGDPQVPHKDWTASRQHFLYLGGTGSVQKGVDLLIEAFAQEPRRHLHICAPLEPVVLRAYRRELSSPNIHYAHHLRFFPSRMEELMNKCAFAILCGFNSGQSTALLGCLGKGMIPVVNQEADIEAPGMRIESSSVDGVRSAVQKAAGTDPDTLHGLSRGAIDSFKALYTPEAFRESVRVAIAGLLEQP
jgi:hypothetical protein